MIDIVTSAKRASVRRFDMTPMIDVVFQLIIFFMFTSQFGQISRTEIDLPREKGLPEAPSERPAIVIDIQENGDLRIDGRAITLGDIDAIIGRRGGGDAVAASGGVLIRGHRLAKARTLNAVTSALNANGVSAWSLGVSDQNGGGRR